MVVADVAEKYSHWTAVESLGEWCAREGVPAISGVEYGSSVDDQWMLLMNTLAPELL